MAAKKGPYMRAIAAQELSKEASDILLSLAGGKYDQIRQRTGAGRRRAGKNQHRLSWAITARRILTILVAINKATAPAAVVPDGRGGRVPATNSRVGPGGKFL
jgi:hypothetical protein